MASVVGKQKSRIEAVFKVGRCLRGLVDGKAVFRFVSEPARREKIRSSPAGDWIKQGWFSNNLLDE